MLLVVWPLLPHRAFMLPVTGLGVVVIHYATVSIELRDEDHSESSTENRP
jgi:hypothetical protein